MKKQNDPKLIYYPTISGTFYVRCRAKPGPKPLSPELKKWCVNISLSPYWHNEGKGVTVTKGLSFSSYFEWLIYTDSFCNESV